jgi:hypothetical protein
MRTLLLICAGLLLLGLSNFPIGFYTLLRIAVTIGSIAIVVTEYKRGIGFWVFSFGLIASCLTQLFQFTLMKKIFGCP